MSKALDMEKVRVIPVWAVKNREEVKEKYKTKKDPFLGLYSRKQHLSLEKPDEPDEPDEPNYSEKLNKDFIQQQLQQQDHLELIDDVFRPSSADAGIRENRTVELVYIVHESRPTKHKDGLRWYKRS